MATCAVTGTLVDSSATAVSGATIRFRVTKPVLDSSNNLVLPTEINTTSASNGSWSLSIDQGISGILMIDYPLSAISPNRRDAYSLTIPSQSTATFSSLFPTET